MIRPVDETSATDPSPRPSDDDDERVGEAIEAYLNLIEQGEVPDPDRFSAGYPGLEEDVRAALQGLELVNGLVGHLPGGSSSGSAARPGGPGRSLESGRRIAGYRIVRELGRGGMGAVYEAVHIALDRPVALKILGSHAAPDSSARRRFLNEARTAARLHHTNIVPVFDVGQVGGLCYYAMQRIEGTGLDCVLRRQRRLRNLLGGQSTLTSSREDAGRGRGAVSPLSQSNSSRFGQLWFRVSAGWLKRSNHESPQPIEDGADRIAEADARTNIRLGRGPELAETQRTSDPGSDLTGSWAGPSTGDPIHSQAQLGRTSNPSGLSLSSSAAAGEFLSGRADDPEDEPPFNPPRGSAFYRWIAEVGLQAAEALAHAHHQGVIHRDVKPSNLLIDDKGTVWVTDFGLARRLADPSLTQQDSLLGTPRYMSPEQARPGPIDGRTDIFSLGGTLYELLTLRSAFDGKSAAELVEQIAKLDPPPPRSIDHRIPRDLETIVLKMLAKRPADRYASAAGLAEDLARFLNHEPVKARRISPVGRLWRVARRHPGITGVSSVAAATILAVATYAHIRVVTKNGQYLAQLRTSHWQNAALVRLSPGMLERRARGLDLIKKAADLDPDPDLKQKLRDEAVDFLMLRDVEKSAELETGRVRGLLFSAEQNRLAVLTEPDEGEQLAFWDIASNEKISSISLGASPRPGLPGGESPGSTAQHQPGPAANRLPNEGAGEDRGETGTARRNAQGSTPGFGFGPGGGGRPGAGNLQAGFSGRNRSSRLAPAGRAIAVILPGDRLSRILEAFTRAQMVDSIALALTGQRQGVLTPAERLTQTSRGLPAFTLRDRGLRFYDPMTGEVTGDLKTPIGNLQAVYGASGGTRLVTIDQEFSAGRGGDPQRRFEVNLWDPEAPKTPLAVLELPRSELPAPPSIAPPLVGFSPDGEKIALGWGSLAAIFSAKDGIPLGKVDTQTPLSALAIGPNDLLATAGGGNVQLWNMESQTLLSSLTPSQNVVSTMRFSPKGSALAIVGQGDSTIELIDPIGRAQITTLRTPERVSDVAFSPDGQALSAGGLGLTTTVWKVLDSDARIQLSGFDDPAASLAFRKDGFLAVGTSKGEIWGCRLGKHEGTSCTPLFSDSTVRTPAPSASAEILAGRAVTPPPTIEPFPIGSAGRSSELFPDRGPARGPGGDRDLRGSRDRPPPLQSVFLAYDDRDRLVVAHDSGPLRTWPGRTEGRAIEPMISLPLPSVGGSGPQRGSFRSLSRIDDGRTMLVSRAARFFLWRSDSPEALVPINPPGPEREPASGLDPSNPATGRNPGSREVAKSNIPPNLLPTPPGRGARMGGSGGRLVGGRYSSARLAPGGTRIYVLNMSMTDFEVGTPQAWDLHEKGDQIQSRRVDWPSSPGEVASLALSADGGLLALGTRSGTVLLVETEGLQVVGQVEPASEGGGPVQAMAFSADGLQLAVATQHGPIFLSQLRMVKSTGDPRTLWEPRFQLRLPVHRAPVRLLAFDARGTRLAGAGTDPLVEVWDLAKIRGELTRLGLDD